MPLAKLAFDACNEHWRARSGAAVVALGAHDGH